MVLITELRVVSGKESKAPDGFEMIPLDLNKGAGGEYLYLCCKKEDTEKGIIDVLVLHDKNADGQGNVCPEGYTRIDVDLNKGAGGQYIYFAYKIGTPEQSRKLGITDMTVLDKGMMNSNLIHEYKNYMLKAFDLNKGAKGAYLYLAYKNASNISLCNWMSLLPDDRRVVDVSIPGTHDTMAYSVIEEYKGLKTTKLAKTQTYDLLAQLECGARYVDIRATSQLKCHHSRYTCSDDFKKAIEDIASFLRNNKKEFVVVRLGDQRPDESKKAFLESLLEGNHDVIWEERFDVFSNVTVDRLRGKMMFLYGGEFSDYVSNKGIKYTKSADYLEIQDDYNGPSVKDKYREVKDLIENRKKDRLTINHVSAAMEGNAKGVIEAYFTNDTTPEGYSDNLNPMVEKYLLHENGTRTDIGIIIYDFINSDLSWAVIKHNFGI